MNNKPFTVEELEQAKSWEIPVVENPKSKADLRKTNLLNRRSDWKYEPPEEEPEILPPTAEEIEAIRQAAYEEGFEQGKQEGFEKGQEEGLQQGHEQGLAQGIEEGQTQGLEQGQAQIDELATIWQQLTDTLHHPLEKADVEVKQQLVKLSVALARSVIRKETTTSPDVILQALSEGMKALPIEEKDYQIHLHPEDLAVITSHFGEEEIQQKGWHLVEAPSAERGGCEIITKNNAVDVSIERRARQVLDKFLSEQGLSDE